MRMDDHRVSDNVEDRRDDGGGGGGGGWVPGGGGIGIGTIVIALLGALIFGVNPMTIIGALGGAGGGEPPTVKQAPAQRPPSSDPLATFVSKVLADTEDVWHKLFRQYGREYQDPKLVLFRGATRTACGAGQAAMGPFYCPADQKVYIDLNFYQMLRDRMGAPGEFAQAYVIAHEVGHHVQNLLGISDQVDQMRGRVSQAEFNAISVRLELQADCFAGVWANHAQAERKILENGDIESAMNAAAKIGDDAMMRNAGQAVVPERFTHGSGAQRQRWFMQGLQTGSMKACDTFNARAV